MVTLWVATLKLPFPTHQQSFFQPNFAGLLKLPRKKLLLLFFVLGALLLTGCVSGDRMMRNSPFSGRGFYRDGVNLWPLYYQEGDKHSILFPLIDIDDRGFAVRPFYHKDGRNHGILWPLCAYNTLEDEGWFGPFLRFSKTGYGLLPLFIKDDEFLWVFPASWYSERYESYALLPLFYKNKEVLWIGNFFKKNDMFLIFPIYGQGNDWFYFLNFINASDSQEKSYWLIPLAHYKSNSQGTEFHSPLVSFGYHPGQLNWLNIGLLLYHYSHGKHHVFYPFADIDIGENYKEFWLWPLFIYGENRYHDVPFYLFDYINNKDRRRINIFNPLLFSYDYCKDFQTSEMKILPFGSLWYAETGPENFDHRLLGGAVYLNMKDDDSRRFSLLYKFFSYHRYGKDVKWEFFPFIKIMETPRGDSWSFCWHLLEKHDGGGHIFFIPWGSRQTE